MKINFDSIPDEVKKNLGFVGCITWVIFLISRIFSDGFEIFTHVLIYPFFIVGIFVGSLLAVPWFFILAITATNFPNKKAIGILTQLLVLFGTILTSWVVASIIYSLIL